MEAGRFRLDDFELYCLARAYRKRVYQLIKVLPIEEKYCLGPQMRRAAVSITNNIARATGAGITRKHSLLPDCARFH